MTYTLGTYYRESGVEQDVRWADDIEMLHSDGQTFIPDPHQRTGLNRALSYSRFGLYDVCDMGKTCVMQAYSCLYAQNGYKVVAIMLPILVIQFEEKLSQTFKGIETKVWAHPLNTGPAKRDKLFSKWKADGNFPDIMIMSYEMFMKEWRRLLECGYNVLVADEADKLCNCETIVHKAVKQFAEEVDGKGEECAMLLSTGTPIRKELEEAYGLISTITPDTYANKGQFDSIHVDYFKQKIERVAMVGGKAARKSGTQLTIINYFEKELLTRNLYAQARRITKDQIGRHEKPRITELSVELDPAHKTLYRRLLKERILEIDGMTIDVINAQALRQTAMQLIATPHRYVDAGVKIRNALLEALEAYASSMNIENTEETEHVARGEKLTVFCHFRSTVEHLIAHFKHLNPASIYGGTRDAQKEKRKFLKDDSCRILIGNATSMGAGVDDLQHVCSKAVFYEPCSVPRTFIQSVERINRRGQQYQTYIMIMKALGTIAPKLTDIMLERNQEIKFVNRDKFSYLDELYGLAYTGADEAPF